MTDARIPSLLRSDERVLRMMGYFTQLTFRQPLERALGRCCSQSNGLQSHCRQYHLAMTVDEYLAPVNSMS